MLVPGILLAIGGPLFGWAKPVPVATKALRNPRLAIVLVALAGPLANLRHGVRCGARCWAASCASTAMRPLIELDRARWRKPAS